MSRPTAGLPPAEAQTLQALREAGPNSLPKLRARVAVLREAGWSLAAVGAPLGANRSTTRMWQMSAAPEDVVKSVAEFGAPPAAPPRRAAAKVVRLYPDVPKSERAELCKLAAQARLVRGHTPPNAPARKAAEEFERRLKAYKARGVPVKRMAEICEITHHAVAARIERSELKLQLQLQQAS